MRFRLGSGELLAFDLSPRLQHQPLFAGNLLSGGALLSGFGLRRLPFSLRLRFDGLTFLACGFSGSLRGSLSGGALLGQLGGGGLALGFRGGLAGLRLSLQSRILSGDALALGTVSFCFGFRLGLSLGSRVNLRLAQQLGVRQELVKLLLGQFRQVAKDRPIRHRAQLGLAGHFERGQARSLGTFGGVFGFLQGGFDRR